MTDPPHDYSEIVDKYSIVESRKEVEQRVEATAADDQSTVNDTLSP